MRVVKCLTRVQFPEGESVPLVSLCAIVYFHADWKEYFVRYLDMGNLVTTRPFGDDKQGALDSADWYVNGMGE